jgi:hypothetical protein
MIFVHDLTREASKYVVNVYTLAQIDRMCFRKIFLVCKEHTSLYY